MIVDEQTYLAHYGILRKSGRYPWGSGGTQSARNKTFLDTVADLKKQGLSDAQIAEGFSTDEHPFTSTQLRAARSIALAEQKQAQMRQAQRLKDKGYSNVAIGKRMNLNESSVRALLSPGQKDKADALQTTANMLKDQVDKHTYIDIGTGVENHVGVSSTRLNTAVAVLQEKGYTVRYLKVPQLGTGKNTTVKVLAKPDSPFPKIDQVKSIATKSDDGGRSFNLGTRPPTNVSSKRVDIAYAEDGGSSKDGLIEIRPGAKDLDLGASGYAQVRIAVDGSHYLKGMAIYNKDLPSNVNLRFNTNKHDTGNKHDAMKPMEKKPDGSVDLANPFGASIKPGGQRGALNIVNEEGDWDSWGRNLPTQMLSKQSPDLAKKQLDVTYERRRKEFDDLSALTNPVVRRKLLEGFADGTDSASVHLKAAAIPRQATKVILPVNAVKPTEIYAPSFRNGDRVALVRYPHGGTFEIPELTVNNRNPVAKQMLGNAKDAVGIHSKVAERLSGADFDGDTVVVIPNNQGKIKSTPALEGLKNFDPMAYKIPEGSSIPRISPRRKQMEMGYVTNLIADMTVKGANTQELARAVRHSMVVIDSEKHGLDYKASAIDNGIPQLKTKYQGSPKAGAATLITRAASPIRIPEIKPRSAAKGGPVDRATGKKVFEETGATFVNKQGKTIVRTTEVKRMSITDDARTLLSDDPGTHIENIYADHANRLKALANTARKEAVNTPRLKQSTSAKKTYTKQVEELNAALDLAQRNAPLERQAQLLANALVAQKRQSNPNMDSDDVKKISNQALAEMRARTGAKKQRIDLTQEQWNAIQAGAISDSKLKSILDNADLDKVRELATPKTKLLMTPSKVALAKLKLANGYTQAEVADDLGISLTTLKSNLSG